MTDADKLAVRLVSIGAGFLALFLVSTLVGVQLNAERRFDCLVSLNGINVSPLELQMLCENF